MDLYQIQKNILQKAKIDPGKVSAWIYEDQSIVFDFLLNDYFVSISYSTSGQSFNFIERNKSKVSKISIFPKFLKYISEIYGSYPQSVNQEKTVLSFKFAEADWVKIEDKFSEILEVTSIYLGSELCYILNVEKNKGINLAEYLDKPEVEYIGVKGDSNEFFLTYARKHGLSNYVYELNNKGFLAVEHKMGVSVFRRVNKHSYKDLLAYFSDSFHELENVLYTVEAPKSINANKKNLLILFPYTHKNNENMLDRYYSHPFPFIANNIMPNTYIIRVTDIAGAFGSHGLNTKFDENIEDNIQRFIKSLMNIYGIEKENVILSGFSSGGTSAIYHGLIGGYKTFAIDPFLGNHNNYYNGKDPVYLYSIRKPIMETFKELPTKINHNFENQVVISSAKVSEFYQDIKEFKRSLPAIVLYEFDFEKIQKHTDFPSNASFLIHTIINNLLLDIHITDSDINLN